LSLQYARVLEHPFQSLLVRFQKFSFRFILRFYICTQSVVYGQFMEKHAIFKKREYDTLPHLQLLFSLQVSARLWHVGISAPSMRCAQVGCIFSCATMHSSFLLSVFLQREKHRRIYISIKEFFNALLLFVQKKALKNCNSNNTWNKKHNWY